MDVAAPYLIFAGVYLIGFHLVLFGVDQVHKWWFITRKLQKNPKAEVGSRWLSRIHRLIMFTARDKRDLVIKETRVKRAVLFWSLHSLGLILSVLTPLIGPVGIITGFALFVSSTVFGVKSAKTLLEKRERVTRRLAEIAVKNLGHKQEAISNPSTAVKVTKWREMVFPDEIEFIVPTGFDQQGEAAFLRMVNQVFGQQTAFVSNDVKNNDGSITPGWDYEEGVARLKAVPPLPTIAPWKDHYVKDPAIAWSFFPLALGVEGGVELPNPETGEVEHVLGFDVSGLQRGQAEKMGYRVGDEITTSPMALVSGGTGGGKAQALTTNIRVRRPAR